MRVLALALCLVATPVMAAESNKLSADLQKAFPGASAQAIDAYAIWVEGQYHLGMCQPYIEERYFVSARNWIRDPAKITDPKGDPLADFGDKQFYLGVQDSLKDPLGEVRCKRVLADWDAAFEKAVSALDAG